MSDETARTVAATLRIVAEQVRDERDREELLATAEQVETALDDTCCPLCEEATCDDSCPLTEARAIALEAPCGFLHDQWDGPYRMRRRCIAPAGHTAGQFAYDHGPWQGVPLGEKS